jgi:hypothetical protein
MVSIHSQTNITQIVERIRRLKSLGYRLIVRAVCSVKMLNLIDELDRRFQQIGVTFTPLPEYEFRAAASTGGNAVVRSYTEEQRMLILNHVKGFGELAMLYGGVDVTDRQCGAGSRMLFLNTQSVQHLGQISPCNIVSDYIMADVAQYIGPSARPIETLLLTGSQPCFRPTKKCDCPGLVEHNVIDGVQAWERYEQMAAGYVSSLGARATDWIRDNNIKFGNDMADSISLSARAEQPQLLEAIGVFNIVKFRGRFFGIPQSLGPLDLTEYEEVESLPGVLIADSLQNARRKVRVTVGAIAP